MLNNICLICHETKISDGFEPVPSKWIVFERKPSKKKKIGVERKRWMRKISAGHNAFTIFPRVNPFVKWFGNENAPKLCLSLAYISPVYLHNLLSFLSFPEIGAQIRSVLWLVLKYCRGPLLYVFCLHIFIKHFPSKSQTGYKF